MTAGGALAPFFFFFYSSKPFPAVCTSVIFPSACLASHSVSSSSAASLVLLKFRTDKGRDPDPQSFPEDSELLKQIRDDVLAAMKVNGDLLSDEFTRYTPPGLFFITNTNEHID